MEVGNQANSILCLYLQGFHFSDHSWPQEMLQLLPFSLYSSQQVERKDKEGILYYLKASHRIFILYFIGWNVWPHQLQEKLGNLRKIERVDVKRPPADFTCTHKSLHSNSDGLWSHPPESFSRICHTDLILRISAHMMKISIV